MSLPVVIGGRLRRPLLDDRQAAAAEIGLAVLLSLAIVPLVRGQGGDALTAAAAVTMTLPVAYARQSPTAAGFTLAAAAAVNELFFGHLARCGAALPAAFFVAYVAGHRLGRRGVPALCGVAVSIVVQCVFDPRLGAGAIALMLPLAVVFFSAGLYVLRRASMVAQLQESTAMIYTQREETARLAVAADRAQVVGLLNQTLQREVDALAHVTQGSGASRERFAAIEQIGRHTLDQMRDLVESLRDTRTQPEPGLADLADICAHGTVAEVQLTVDGATRPLPPSIELSACRIVEQLLQILPNEPNSRVQLKVEVTTAGVDIAMTGRASATADVEQIRAIAQTRAAVHGGRVAVADRSGQRQARVWLPLVTAHG